MYVRRYEEKDLEEILKIFYNSVRNIKSYNYTREEIEHWAPDNPDVETWEESLKNNITFVADDGGRIVGFGELTKDGYVNRLYIHNAFQGQGVGALLISEMEVMSRELNIVEINVHAAVVAKSFYEKQGYICEGTMKRDYNGLIYTNYIMKKTL